jgi:hypothetical protein
MWDKIHILRKHRDFAVPKQYNYVFLFNWV